MEPEPDADCSLIIAYIYDVLAGGNEMHGQYIITWLADIVQNYRTCTLATASWPLQKP